jgi:hypothetical protein
MPDHAERLPASGLVRIAVRQRPNGESLEGACRAIAVVAEMSSVRLERQSGDKPLGPLRLLLAGKFASRG